MLGVNYFCRSSCPANNATLRESSLVVARLFLLRFLSNALGLTPFVIPPVEVPIGGHCLRQRVTDSLACPLNPHSLEVESVTGCPPPRISAGVEHCTDRAAIGGAPSM
jgi:hypothetical protein